jgi:hypothetical protein
MNNLMDNTLTNDNFTEALVRELRKASVAVFIAVDEPLDEAEAEESLSDLLRALTASEPKRPPQGDNDGTQ